VDPNGRGNNDHQERKLSRMEEPSSTQNPAQITSLKLLIISRTQSGPVKATFAI
jgi:hypothetical protein